MVPGDVCVLPNDEFAWENGTAACRCCLGLSPGPGCARAEEPFENFDEFLVIPGDTFFSQC